MSTWATLFIVCILYILSLLTSDISQMTITQLRKSFQKQLPGQNRYFKNRFSYGDKNSDCKSIALENDTKLSRDTPEGQDVIQRWWEGSLRIGPEGISWGSTRPSAKCCTWVRATSSINTRWGMQGEGLGSTSGWKTM